MPRRPSGGDLFSRCQRNSNVPETQSAPNLAVTAPAGSEGKMFDAAHQLLYAAHNELGLSRR
jgi:hypothetical protein